MAKEIPYTDKIGNNYPNSYWKIIQVEINIKSKYARYVFEGYKDKTCYDNKKQPIDKISFVLVGDLFEQYYGKTIEKEKDFIKIGYEVCCLIPPENIGLLKDSEPSLFFDKNAVDV